MSTAQLKRPRSATDSDDETPLFSPSPSKSESECEDEAIDTSLYRSIGSGNLGRTLLLKMGWREGTGLGVGGFGRVDPVPISDKRGGDLTGIGKMSLDTRTIESSTANRRFLESERQLNETEAEREIRFITNEKKQAQKEDVTQALKTYRCDLCQKQYDRPSSFEAHLNSYDHHHKKRFMEMKQTQRGKTEAMGMMEKKRDKEKRREEREMAKMAEAAGVKLSSALDIGPPILSQSVPAVGTSSGGWKKVNTAKSSSAISLTSNPSASNSTVGGWKTVTGSSSWKSFSKPSVSNPLPSSGVDSQRPRQMAQEVPSTSIKLAIPPPEIDPPPHPP